MKKAKVETGSVNIEPKFSKEQILSSVSYAEKKDLVNALLENGKEYTKSEVDEIITKFMKGKVK